MLDIEQITQKIAHFTLTTERLKLRLFNQDDEANEIRLQQDPEVMKYIRPPQTEEQVKEYMVKLLSPYQGEEGVWQGFCVDRIDDNQSIGAVSFRFESIDFAIVELGYRFDTKFHGKGYATEAVDALLGWLFQEINIHKAVAKCDPDNIGSFKVMEKLNMQKEALLRQHYKLGEHYTDELIYGILSDEYEPIKRQK